MWPHGFVTAAGHTGFRCHFRWLVLPLALAFVSSACLFTGDGSDVGDTQGATAAERRRAAGEVIGVARAREAALTAALASGEDQPAFDKLHLTTYANARDLLDRGSRNLSLAEQDLVYVVTMTGRFDLRRAENAERIYMILDAYTADVLAMGTLQ